MFHPPALCFEGMLASVSMLDYGGLCEVYKIGFSQTTKRVQQCSRWLFQTFSFSPLPGKMIQFDQYFSNGLVQPKLDICLWTHLYYPRNQRVFGTMQPKAVKLRHHSKHPISSSGCCVHWCLWPFSVHGHEQWFNDVPDIINVVKGSWACFGHAIRPQFPVFRQGTARSPWSRNGARHRCLPTCRMFLPQAFNVPVCNGLFLPTCIHTPICDLY